MANVHFHRDGRAVAVLRVIKRHYIALRQALAAHRKPRNSDTFARVEQYANGERRLQLISADPADEQHWHHRRSQIEAALAQALTKSGMPNPDLRTLRLHSGRGCALRIQCWRVPAPYGHHALGELAGILATLDVLDERTDVVSD